MNNWYPFQEKLQRFGNINENKTQDYPYITVYCIIPNADKIDLSYSHINLASYQKPYLNLLPTVAITNWHNNKWFHSVHVKEHRHGV